MQTSNEAEELDDLLSSPGWGRFVEWVVANYGTAKFATVATQLALSNKSSETVSQQLRAANEALGMVAGILEWPKRRIDTLRREPPR